MGHENQTCNCKTREERVTAQTYETLLESNMWEAVALSPLDGRYAQIARKLLPYFSEYALVKNRVKVEVCWLEFLLETVDGCKILDEFDHLKIHEISSIYDQYDMDSFKRVKEIEKEINHDVKAVEKYVGEKLKTMGMNSLISFVHIGCTSEDITNCSYASMIKEALYEVWIPTAEKLIDSIQQMAIDYIDTPMLAHTHGQPATPTTVGKELCVYAYRLTNAICHIKSIKPCAKFNGATGNYAAISVAFPKENWPVLSKHFVEDYLGLNFNPVTTQIENHDYICHILDGIRHFNNVLRDFDLDMWLYISMEYFKQIAVKNEVGSSTMPHKVNPIRFENSESNIKMSNGICYVLSDELPRSRMQRDLSDSSLQRNIGLAFGYSLQAIEQTTSGLKRVEANKEKMLSDLENNWEVLAEPIQTMLRKYGKPDAYDQLKELTRGKQVTREILCEFIADLEILSREDEMQIFKLTPSNYYGLAPKIVEDQL